MEQGYAAVQENIKIVDTMPCIVPAMDILISNPEILSPKKEDARKADHLYIPIQYLDKLGHFCDDPYRTTRQSSAKMLIEMFKEMLASIHYQGDPKKPYYQCPNGMRVGFYRTAADKSGSTKLSAITLAQELRFAAENSKKHNEVKIMTCDNLMAARAYDANIETVHIEPETYTGHRTVKLPSRAMSDWTRHDKRLTLSQWNDIFGQSEPPLHPNEYIEFIYESGDTPTNFSNIGRFDPYAGTSGAIVPLRYTRLAPPYHNIGPQNAFQAMLMESLMAPPNEISLVIVDGSYGSGKTFLSILAGLYGYGYGRSLSNQQSYYENGIFVVPRDGGPGKEIGYLPGGITEKTMPKSLPVIDSLKSILKQLKIEPPKNASENLDEPIYDSRKKGKKARKNFNDQASDNLGKNTNSTELKRILKDVIEFQPLINVGGRSIEDAYLYFDEAHCYEIFQAELLASRMGNGSKSVFTGDTAQQYATRLGSHNNAISHMIGALKNNPYTSIIVDKNPENIVRNEALRSISRDLGVY